MKHSNNIVLISILSTAMFLTIAFNDKVFAGTHVVTSFPTLINDSDAICIGSVIWPTAGGQPVTHEVDGPGDIQVKILSVLKGVITHSIVNVHLAGDQFIIPGFTTGMFFLNGEPDDEEWCLVPVFPPSLIELNVDVQAAPLATDPLFTVVTVLCKVLPNLNEEDRLEAVQRLFDVPPLLYPKRRDVVLEIHQLGGLSNVQAFVKATILPAIEPYYTDADPDVRRLSVRLGNNLQDAKANAPLPPKTN